MRNLFYYNHGDYIGFAQGILFSVLLYIGSGISQINAQEIDLTELSINDLMQTEVTTVSRSEQRFADTSAAIFVINRNDIEHSGVTNVPDLLRMVPGMHVARISSSKWAVSARGQNSRFANKLQVLIDGRSIYTPTFSGTYWESHDLVLEDIERIEVVRGPGSSIWGANAVNGVINIITRNSGQTQGALVSVNAGGEEQIAALRYGGKLSEQANYRAYIKYLHRDSQLDENGLDAHDNWQQWRGGFRMDWVDDGDNEVFFSSDLYSADMHHSYTDTGSVQDPGVKTFNRQGESHGGSLQAQWTHHISTASKISSQIYYQNFYRRDEIQNERRHTLDLDVRHELALQKIHHLIWGAGYRVSHDSQQGTYFVSADPAEETLHLFHAFVQDRMQLFDNRVELTLGTRVQYHSYDDWQFLPTAKLLWKVHPRHRLWTSVSRSTRTPARSEIAATYRPVQVFPELPVNIQVQGGEVGSEKVMSYEVGYRTWPLQNLSFDLAFFYNQYRDAIMFQFDSFSFSDRALSFTWDNALDIDSLGAELSADWRPLDNLKFNLAYTYLQEYYDLEKITVNIGGFNFVPSNVQNPQHQVSLRSTISMPHDLSLDLWYRYTSEIETLVTPLPYFNRSIPAYHAFDLRLAWSPTANWQIAFVGKNLNQSATLQHMELTATFPTQIERSIYAQIVWTH